MWQEQITLNGPYNFDEVLRRHAIDPLSVISFEKRMIKVPLTIDGKPTVAMVTALGTTEEPSFVVTGQNLEKKAETIAQLSDIFQWKIPLQKVIHHFEKTSLRNLFVDHYGTPLVLDFNPYSCLLKCIIHQQLNMAFAHTLSTRFVHKFGQRIDGVWFYPTPEVVASLKVEQLRGLQFSGRKAEYVIGVGQAAYEGKLDFEKITRQSDEEIFAELTRLRGVGPWTVQNFLMFGLGRPNLFPTADIGIQNALKKLYGMERKPTNDEMEQFKQGWDPYLSYASLYLWRSIE